MDYITEFATTLGVDIQTFEKWWMSLDLGVDLIVQMFVVVVLAGLSYVMAGRTATWVKKRIKSRDSRRIIQVHLSYQEIFALFYLVAFLWFALSVAEGLAYSHGVLQTVASLVTAWSIIRVTSSAINNAFWSRLIALFLWTIAALNIVGWLDHIIQILEKAEMTAGGLKVSLYVLIKSMIALAILLWLVRVISGLLEHGFKKAHSLTPSQRALFFKVSNIMLYIIAVVVGLNIAGLDLTALTVFSGALGLGIGFGLQKVFSNLISGMILLLDRSVKPGDVIVVENTFGWVNSLGARCVSVLTRDGKEHLIPNENLITQRVENWSYSDSNVCVSIDIGVSYNADLNLVKELLIKAVEGHDRVLARPQPQCFITGFGDSAVNHVLRIWIDDPAAGIINLKSDLYYSIWNLFKEYNIEIPFPQRDVHIKQSIIKNESDDIVARAPKEAEKIEATALLSVEQPPKKR